MGISLLLIVLLAVAPPLLILGIGILRRGLRPPRRGTDPHCGKCDYSLVGLTSNRCPECGTELVEGAIAIGQRTRRPGLVAAGSGAILLALILLVPLVAGLARSIPWIKVKPDFMLMSDVRSGVAYRQMEALYELRLREAGGGLSQGSRDRLIELGLKEQASTSTSMLTQAWIDMLADLYELDRLSEAQKNLFMDQIVNSTLITRSQLAPGDPFSVMITRGNRASQKWWVREVGGDASIDGKHAGQFGGNSSSFGLGAGGHATMTLNSPPPGHHEIKVVWHIEVYQFPQSQLSELVFKRDRTLTGTFEVLAAEPAGYIKTIDDPSLAPSMQSSFTPQEFKLGPTPNRLSGQIESKALRADVSFDVYARVGDREYRMSAITGRAGSSTTYVLGSALIQPDSPPSKVDIILRSSEKPVRSTVDQNQFWKGELIYRDVPVKNISPTIGP